MMYLSTRTFTPFFRGLHWFLLHWFPLPFLFAYGDNWFTGTRKEPTLLWFPWCWEPTCLFYDSTWGYCRHPHPRRHLRTRGRFFLDLFFEEGLEAFLEVQDFGTRNLKSLCLDLHNGERPVNMQGVVRVRLGQGVWGLTYVPKMTGRWRSSNVLKRFFRWW